jgi:methylmalonyl-CoA mutase, N-terminal domain
VNRYVEGAEEGKAKALPHIDVFRVDPGIEAQQIARLQSLRATRGGEWKAALAAVSDAARGTANLVPPIITAVEQRATLGEIADALRSVFGEFQDTSQA